MVTYTYDKDGVITSIAPSDGPVLILKYEKGKRHIARMSWGSVITYYDEEGNRRAKFPNAKKPKRAEPGQA